MMRPLLAAPLLLLAACGSRPAGDSVANDAARQNQMFEAQVRALSDQAENSTGTIERAMENETQVLFDRREALLNGALDAVNAIDAAPSGTPQARRR